MKKNAMLKIAAILMVAVLLTTCAISSTFAKYVTNGAAGKTSTARVAKWGVVIDAIAADDVALFLNAYDDNVTPTVKGEGTDIVVAPGTTNDADLLKFTVSGTPEVDFKLNAFVDVTLDKWDVAEDACDADGHNAGYYCPLAFTIDTTTYYGNSYETAAEFEAAIEEAIAKALLGNTATPGSSVKQGTNAFVYSATYEAGKSMSDFEDGVNVTWSWAFEADDTNDAGVCDACDSALGNVAAADASNAATVKIDFTLSAEQVD